LTLAQKLAELKSIFIDTAPVIYHIEAHPEYGPLMKDIVKRIQSGNLIAYTTVVTITEVLPKPVSLHKEELVQQFIEFFKKGENINLLEISSDIAEGAGRLRGKYEFLKTIDALQISASISVKADAFLTNDIKLKNINENNIIVLKDFI
jgi:predicted nucleic acid-binding protein